MATLAVKLREQKRRKVAAKFKARRQALLDVIRDPRTADEDREAARLKLQNCQKSFVAGWATSVRRGQFRN